MNWHEVDRRFDMCVVGGGLSYVDELVQVGVNQDLVDASEQACERFYWSLHDANYNVLGLSDNKGALIERYEYTPYGQRTVYLRGWLAADVNGDGIVSLADWNYVVGQFGSLDPADIPTFLRMLESSF